MRARVRRLVVACLVLLALGLATALVATRVLRGRMEEELRRQAIDILPQVAQRIRDFHRVKVDRGRKVWEVSAREAQYHDEEKRIAVTDPVVSLFTEDGREVAVRGREANVFLTGHDLQAIELVGDIHVKFGDYALRTEHARYERNPGVILAPGSVEITGTQLDLHGDQLELDLASERLLLHENVRMVLRPQATPNGSG
jgi:LPS export ABC transporter protein LptC